MQRRLNGNISPAVGAKPSTVAYKFHILEQMTHKYHKNEFSLSQIFISREKTFKNFYIFRISKLASSVGFNP